MPDQKITNEMLYKALIEFKAEIGWYIYDINKRLDTIDEKINNLNIKRKKIEVPDFPEL